MPRKSRKSASLGDIPDLQPRKPSDDASWGGFINVVLSDDEKTTAKAWIAQHELEIVSHLGSCTWEGLKFSLTADPSSDCYLATFTGTISPGGTARYAMTARGAAWFDALGLLVYKHVVMCEGNWGRYKPRDRKFDTFG